MLLSDRDIRSELEYGDLDVSPIDYETQLQPASIDVRLGSEFQYLPERDVVSIRDELEGPTEMIPEGKAIAIEPDDFVLGTTIETVDLPSDMLARLEGRSSVGRLSVSIHSTAGIIDPGWTGPITLEISSDSDRIILLEPGMRIGQLTIEPLSSPAERPYGAERGSKYQGQSGPTASRIHQDDDLE